MQRTLYLDTNLFIAAFESAGPRADELLRVLDAIGEGEFVGTTSELTLAELLPQPFARGQDELAAFYASILSGQEMISVHTVGRSILVASARLRAEHRSLKLPDAIHLATALHCNCGVILSNDERLPSIPQLTTIRLTSSSLADLRALH